MLYCQRPSYYLSVTHHSGQLPGFQLSACWAQKKRHTLAAERKVRDESKQIEEVY